MTHPVEDHRLADVEVNAAPMTIPLPRREAAGWPARGEVAHVPVALLLAASGRCSCHACSANFARVVAKARLRAV